MSLLQNINELITKHFFIVYNERFKSDTTSLTVQRIAAKHILMKPEIIVINDLPQGFRKVKESLNSLEKFPIFIEIENSDMEGFSVVESLDLYAELQGDFSEKLSELKKLESIYNKTLKLETTHCLKTGKMKSLVILSKISSVFEENIFEQDIDDEVINVNDVTAFVEGYFVSFLNFIRVIDEVLNKNCPISEVNKLFNCDNPVK